MPSTDTIILGVAAALFLIALVALIGWAFKALVLGGGGGGARGTSGGFLRGRERRLGVVETASVDGRRKLLLLRRDDVEHLIMIGGPVDMVIETGIEGRRHLEPALGDVVIDRNEPRPAPNFGPAAPQEPLKPPPFGPAGGRFQG